eukprot:TRINITY_DN65269_c0_g1_i1.p1 TRINITY_DN65269_c0_g1~~TRINITY_DN65269_c0_g1_i1.p1  ORF type:complete len:1260 (-),score=309.65 TRINITY_DN65269_c0_g1_i1:444-4223(-)
MLSADAEGFGMAIGTGSSSSSSPARQGRQARHFGGDCSVLSLAEAAFHVGGGCRAAAVWRSPQRRRQLFSWKRLLRVLCAASLVGRHRADALYSASAAKLEGESLTPYSGVPFLEGQLEDVSETCNVETVQGANIRQLHPILNDLVNTTFFRLFRVKLQNPSCPYWRSAEEAATCGSPSGPPLGNPFGGKSSSPLSAAPAAEPSCSISTEEEGSSSIGKLFPASPTKPVEEQHNSHLDRTLTAEEQMASQFRERDDGKEGCEFEEDLPTYFADMCSGDNAAEAGDFEDVNLVKNPERNTGYNGSHIWEAMYSENCFEVGSILPRGRFGAAESMCYEERVLYRLLSGWHSSTTVSIAKYFYAPGTRGKGWQPNPERYMDSVGSHPDRLKNIHFSFVVMLRALKKAAPFLQTYHYFTGDDAEDSRTQSLMTMLLGSQVLSVCSPLFEAFDETRLFSSIRTPEQRSQVKRQFKSVFQNITALVDCVRCMKCRLHAKLFSLGLGTALKILLTPPDLMSSTIARDEVVAMVNVVWKLSDTLEDARELTRLYGTAPKPVPAEPRKGIEPKPTEWKPPARGPPEVAQVPQQQAAPAWTPPGGVQQMPSFSPDERRGLVASAMEAIKRAAVPASADEEHALKAFVLRPPSDELLLLSKHFAAERPDLLVRIAAAYDATPAQVPAASAGGGAVQPAAPALPDAVIIGGGLAGMVCALSMLDRGGTVVLVEKQAFLGGNSGKASSGINAAIGTSIESLIADTTKSAKALARPELISKLANDSEVAVSWLRDRTGVDLSERSQLGGHSVKRTLRPNNAFVGAELTFAIGQLLTKLSEKEPGKLKLLLKTKWSGLKKAGSGGLWNVEVDRAGSRSVLSAANVVITTGGFGHDHKEAESLLLQHRPDLADFPTTLGAQTTGDGVKIARDIGARLVDMDRVQLHPTGFVDPKKPLENTKTLAAELLRGVGGLLVDRNGSRFTDELGTRQAVVDAELRTAAKDGNTRREFSLVLNAKAAAVADRHTTLYSKKGLLTRVSGLKGLASHLDVSEAALWRTFSAYNDAAKSGKDEFGRHVFPAHVPIEKDEDFLVGTVVPVIHYTMGGIAIDTAGRVLSEADDRPIAGLYAAGEASGGVHGDNRLAGNSLLECTVFGRHLGLTLPVRAEATANLAHEEPPQRPADTPPGVEAPAAAAASAEKSITHEELAAHGARAEQPWVALYGKVYDMTDYADEHPGGRDAILDVAGSDATETFETVHNRELLDSLGFAPIGALV